MSVVASLPRVDVELDGEPLAESAVATLEEVRVQHRLSQPSVCELTFFVTRDPIAALQNLRPGSGIRLTLPLSSSCLFQGEITSLEYSYEAAHGQTLRVRCYDKLHRLRKRQPVRAHVQVTVPLTCTTVCDGSKKLSFTATAAVVGGVVAFSVKVIGPARPLKVALTV